MHRNKSHSQHVPQNTILPAGQLHIYAVMLVAGIQKAKAPQNWGYTIYKSTSSKYRQNKLE